MLLIATVWTFLVFMFESSYAEIYPQLTPKQRDDSSIDLYVTVNTSIPYYPSRAYVSAFIDDAKYPIPWHGILLINIFF